ncbi:MAG TPA: hypothetical protein VN289_06325, partial [Paraburkholderia sp.]|nr:hypothetical protein [Paraburkholderia sp.]
PGDGQAVRCEPLSLVTFFAAAKKVTAAPHRGNASEPKTKRGRQRKPKANRIDNHSTAKATFATASQTKKTSKRR